MICAAKRTFTGSPWIFPAFHVTSAQWIHLGPHILSEWEDLHIWEAPHLPSDCSLLRLDATPGINSALDRAHGSPPRSRTSPSCDLYTCLSHLPQRLCSPACQKSSLDTSSFFFFFFFFCCFQKEIFFQFYWELIDIHHCIHLRYTAGWFDLHILWNGYCKSK